VSGGIRRWRVRFPSVSAAATGLEQVVYVRPVEQRVSLITLGVADLAAARRFYEALGWQGQEVEETVFFQTGGSGLVLWSREKLAADAGIEDDGGARFGGIVLAHNVRSAVEVDAVLREAAAAGATITRAAEDTFYGGYAGCFRDLDGHVWEVAWNAGFPLGDDGSITIPDFDAPPTD
jgi:predicted lactoylglutathione lyase